MIRSHLFVIAPNNSGSTVLRNAIAGSTGCWRLPREGQHVPGFVGPSTRGTGTRLIWAATPDRLRLFRDAAAYDWRATKAAWHAQAEASDPTATVLVVSSPPFLCTVSALAEAFEDARFVFLVRDPFAIAGGILRRRAQQSVRPGEDIAVLAAQHILACFAQQADNIAQFGARAVTLTYEALCADPGAAAAALTRLMPALRGIDLTAAVPVKGLYHEPLRDMNAERVAAIDADDRATLARVFASAPAIVERFGYRAKLR